MKKVMFLFLLSLGTSFSVRAQKTPPQTVVTAFNQKFPGMTDVDVDWSKEKNGEWEAEFEQGDVEISANFSADGVWLETETEVKVTDLPAAVQVALTGKKVKEATRIQRADGSTVYEAEVKHKDLIFDAAGNLLSEAKD